MNTEEYENIIGYENLYKINRNGNIYSCWYKKVMTPLINESGYCYLTLKKDGIRSKSFIHRLLGKQYLPNPENKLEIDHIDRNKINNSLENIRWVTRLENTHNKSNYKDNLTPEQLQIRIDRTRERAKLWARKNTASKKLLNIQLFS